MNEDEYITKRLEDQINWYSKKSIKNKKCFQCLRSFEIICAALIPISFYYEPIKFLSPLMGVFVTILLGISSLFKNQELWVSYRTTCESLLHHKFLYLTKTSPYSSDNRFSILVENIENLISKENSIWKNNQQIPTHKGG